MKGFVQRIALVGTAVSAMAMVALMTGISGANATSDPVSDAFDTLNGKVTTYGTALVGLAVAAIVILFGIKWLKKGRSAA